ncbi:hypothetical protein [Lichenihabitans psoromatis]
MLVAASLFVWRLTPPSLAFFASSPPILWTGGLQGASIIAVMTVVAARRGDDVRLFSLRDFLVLAGSQSVWRVRLPQQSLPAAQPGPV